MSEADQTKLGFPPEDSEKDAQSNFAIACQKRGWRPVWHRTDKRSTANRGCPDFIVAAFGRSFWIEFKRPGEHLAPDQRVFHLQLAQNAVFAHIVYSAQEAVDLIEQFRP